MTDMQNRWYGTGRRKCAVARVWMMPGTGRIRVNKRDLDDYFSRAVARLIVRQPLELTGTTDKVDIHVNVRGGGMSGQAAAVKHGISRALEKMNGELRPTLKKAGFLTRDAREVERKKYGLHKARRSHQFSKR